MSDDEAQRLGAAGTALLILADDPSLWRDYKQLIARARLVAEARVAARTPDDGDRP